MLSTCLGRLLGIFFLFCCCFSCACCNDKLQFSRACYKPIKGCEEGPTGRATIYGSKGQWPLHTIMTSWINSVKKQPFIHYITTKPWPKIIKISIDVYVIELKKCIGQSVHVKKENNTYIYITIGIKYYWKYT